ncbi:MAG: hypothetical protein J6A01_06765, partial [Proteobacteria bacterium]|nr:hypothetical protein [Pseudomonadota bacterium]
MRDEAKNQAREELLGYFGIDGNFGAAEDMSIFGENDEAAALLAISIIVQGDLRESKFTERLARISGDIADGTIDNEEIWQQMATGAMAADLEMIRHHIESWGESVPDFEPYVKAFWRDRLGLTTCDNVGEVMQRGEVYLVCTEDGWDKANAQDILNYYLGKCDQEGIIKFYDWEAYYYDDGIMELKPGSYYVCRDGVWKRDPGGDDIVNYYLGVCSKDGEVKAFNCDELEQVCSYWELWGRSFVCRDGGWKEAGDSDILNYYLGECKNANNGEIKEFEGNEWIGAGLYLCRDGEKWEYADLRQVLNYYLGKCDKDGDVKAFNGDELGNLCEQYGLCGNQSFVCRGDWHQAGEFDFGLCENDGAVIKQEEIHVKNCDFEHLVCHESEWSCADYGDVLNYYLGECKNANNGEIKEFEGNEWIGAGLYLCRDG